MKAWLEEAIDQIALGEFLAKSNISCGQRFGLIAVDNAVEFMLIAYIEVYKQLVGGHKVKVGGMAKKEWADTKDKFPKLLSYVSGIEPNLQPIESEINRFHNFRNGLYHSGIPITTTSTRVGNYSKLAQEILAILFGIKLTAQEWERCLAQIASLLNLENISYSSIKRKVTYELVDGFVKFTTSESPTQLEAIALCLHGYSILTGAPPSRPSLVQALVRNGHPISVDIVNARVSDLRKNGWVQKNDLALSSKGRKELMEKYIL